MARNILKEIVDRRIADMEKLGLEFGCPVPSERQRKIHPFIAEKGAILEVKRASPSKGDIAPDLDSGKTARSYAEAGAKAISCLTETNYFKGTLNDLMAVCKAVDEYEKETGKTGPAVLRKDFLVNEAEVEVAYRAGADAVLLIARILDKETILAMAKKAESLGISVLVEIRKTEDLEKLECVLNNVDHKYVVAGVNSRDLKDFTIDMLSPAQMLKSIRNIAQDARVTFESGILSPETAAFASSMDFSAILLGEAAAKDPLKASRFTKAFGETKSNAAGKCWVDYAHKLLLAQSEGGKKLPFIKICGMTKMEDVLLAAELGADFLGFILWPKSKRCTNEAFIRKAYAELKEKYGDKAPGLIGVIVEPEAEEGQIAYKLVREGILEKVQFHSCSVPTPLQEEFADIPRYEAVNITSEADLEKVKELLFYGEPRILIDARAGSEIGGTGKQIDENLVNQVSSMVKLWLAGGISPDNVQEVIEKYNPELIDIASSVESEPGIKDHQKLRKLFENIKRK